MDPSGYCHRKLGRALAPSLPRSLALPAPGFAPSKPHRFGSVSPARPWRSLRPLRHFLKSQWRLFRGSLRFLRLLWLPSTPLSTLNSPLSSQDQALDRLVSSSSIRYRTSTDDLSTLSSSRGLTCLRSGNSLLWGGFTLRCLQRLSRPHFASLLCTWQYNSCTRGASIPVLSY